MTTRRRASDRDPALDAPEIKEFAPSILDGGPASEYVRVRHPQTGDHFTTTRVLAHRMGATLLPDHPAVDQYGQPLPRKPKTNKES